MKTTALLLVVQLAGSAGVAEDAVTASVDLAGTVRADDGGAVPGATVTIWTAAPRKGMAIL